MDDGGREYFAAACLTPKETIMSQYMVERHLPGITPEQLTAAASRAKAVTAKLTDEGKPVRYLRSTFVPSEEKSFCLFEAPSAERVREANVLAEIPLLRIIEVAHIAADDLA
ncbi:hypothetical protein FHS26_004683 [Rhizobium pisi]|uniref:DUF4242 domain-containing protein n=2 Tax=Rhizobium pisi TaxID=574561 RepID=A0A7W5G1N3_9HYPH|nr:hypothetical protein [Rhizobium pisi]